jgi:hypothetical protein
VQENDVTMMLTRLSMPTFALLGISLIDWPWRSPVLYCLLFGIDDNNPIDELAKSSKTVLAL